MGDERFTLVWFWGMPYAVGCEPCKSMLEELLWMMSVPCPTPLAAPVAHQPPLTVQAACIVQCEHVHTEQASRGCQLVHVFMCLLPR